MLPKKYTLFPPSPELTVTGASESRSDGVNPLRLIEHDATLGWPGPPGLFMLQVNVFVRACGSMRLRFGDEVQTFTDTGKGDGYKHLLLKTQVQHPEAGLRIEALCKPQATAPLVLYQADVTRITPPPPPAWEVPLAAVLALLLSGLVGWWLRPWSSERRRR